jgi:MFS family permease
MFLTPFSPNFALASIIYGARALLMNMASPLSQSLIMGLVAEDELCTASGLSGALWRLPSALSTFAGAWLMGMGMLVEPFVIASVFYLVAIMLFWQYFKNAKLPEEQKNNQL